MTNKKKIRILNLLITFISLITIFGCLFVTVNNMFAPSEGLDTSKLIVSADEDLSKDTISKDGLLNMVESGLSYEASKPLSIDTKEDVVAYWHEFISQQYETGAYTSSSRMTTKGTGTLGPITQSFYYLTEEEGYYKDGKYYNPFKCTEIPNSEGKLGKYEVNYYGYDVWEDMICTRTQLRGLDNITTYKKENGIYHVVELGDFSKATSSSFKKLQKNYFGFYLTEDSIADCQIEKSIFSTKAILTLNKKGYEQFSREVWYDKMLSYKIEILFNNYSGNVIQLTRSENYVVESTISITVNRSIATSFKRAD